jgi:hypothetical protein
MRKAVVFVLVAGWVLFGALGADVNPVHANAVPIPSTFLMMGTGLAALAALRRKSK